MCAMERKELVLFLSIYEFPIGFPCMPIDNVPQRNGAVQEQVLTSSIHLEYTMHMRGVDVANELRALYSTQYQSHIWSHRVFFFLTDMTVLNMYLIYLNKCKNRDPPKTPLNHLQFSTQL